MLRIRVSGPHINQMVKQLRLKDSNPPLWGESREYLEQRAFEISYLRKLYRHLTGKCLI